MAVGATRGGETTARKRKHQSGDAVDARARSAPVAFPRLPFDVVVTHVLRETNFPDPADLAVLRAVSRGMRDAVDASLAATGRELCELDDEAATTRGVLSAVTRLKRRGLLKSDVWLSCSEPRSRNYETGETRTCAFAAMGGHLEVLEWLRENKCPWDGDTCSNAAEEGECAEMGARERMSVGHEDVLLRGAERPPRDAAVGARKRLPVGRVHVLVGDEGRPPRGAAVGARERLPVGQGDVRLRGTGRPPRGVEVVARRPPVGRVDVRVGGDGRPPRGAAVGARERLPVGPFDVRERGGARRPRGAEVGARERLPVGRVDVRESGEGRPPRGAEVGARERLPVGRLDVLLRGEGVVSKCCGGRTRTAARGTRGRARTRRVAASSRC